MSHSYMHNPVHLVFGTRHRAKLIPKQSQPHLWAYLADRNSLGLAFSDAIKEIKASSSRWMGPSFAWQTGFGFFGVSASNTDAVIRYIRCEEAHHKKMTFQDELRGTIKKTRRGL